MSNKPRIIKYLYLHSPCSEEQSYYVETEDLDNCDTCVSYIEPHYKGDHLWFNIYHHGLEDYVYQVNSDFVTIIGYLP